MVNNQKAQLVSAVLTPSNGETASKDSASKGGKLALRQFGVSTLVGYRSLSISAKNDDGKTDKTDYSGYALGLSGAFRLNLSKSMGLQFELGVDYSSLSFSKDLGEFGKLEVNYSTVSLAPFLGFTGGALGGAGFAYFAGLELFYPVSQSATLSILGQKETKDKPFDSFLGCIRGLMS